ncbi:cytochrome c oxidase subunit II [Pannus brasiliensis CCIBt3594]|uniref:Cytochrome c oxidase subunit 2 n=1 Tax=Pannus brasiliensis CCIBt3594 TaxID=1427578 RepID=A0AAW9QUQ3_9CHRO
MKIPSSILTLVLGIVITLISLWYGQHHGLMPVAASEDAKEIDAVFNLMMTIATGLFFIVEGVLIYSVIRFRRKPGDQTDGPAIEGNVPLEIFWTAIPTIIVFILAVYSFEIYNNIGGLDPITSRDAAPAVASSGHQHGTMMAMGGDRQVALGIGPDYGAEGANPLVVNVKGIQYAWIFTYPETGITSGELHAPVNRPVQLNMEGGDVIHAFWVPQLRLKQDVIPGRISVLSFTADRVGQYPIICAELCGAYHGGMKSSFVVHSSEDYDKWVQENTIAETESDKTVAVNQTNLTDGQYLAPYVQEMGINTEILARVHTHH